MFVFSCWIENVLKTVRNVSKNERKSLISLSLTDSIKASACTQTLFKSWSGRGLLPPERLYSLLAKMSPLIHMLMFVSQIILLFLLTHSLGQKPSAARLFWWGFLPLKPSIVGSGCRLRMLSVQKSALGLRLLYKEPDKSWQSSLLYFAKRLLPKRTWFWKEVF